MSILEKKICIVTHSGRFHTDEVMAVAALEVYLDGKSYEVLRSRDREVWKLGDYLVDVGGEYDPTRGKFDHHQAGGAGAHADGIPYSAFGAVWKHFGKTICNESEEIAQRIEQKLGYPIDMADNGIDTYKNIYPNIHPYKLHEMVGAFNSTWKEGDHQTEHFMEVVAIFVRLLRREIISIGDDIVGEEVVKKLYEESEDKRIIIMDEQYPNGILAGYPEPLFVVKPARQNTNWEVECVRNEVQSFENRKSLPLAWGGKFGDELAAVSGVADAVFCHKGRFIAVARSKEGAIALAQSALNS